MHYIASGGVARSSFIQYRIHRYVSFIAQYIMAYITAEFYTDNINIRMFVNIGYHIMALQFIGALKDKD